MTDASFAARDMPFAPRVIEGDTRDQPAPSADPLPQVITTERAEPVVPAAQTRAAVAEVLAVVPRDHEMERAIEAFQRQLQAHHGSLQQLELLSRTVIKPLDARAETHIRTAVMRAFGITAISPTALTDA